MAKYGASAKREVKKAIHKTKRGTQRSGRSHKAKSRKQAIAIGLSKARKKGAKVPKRTSQTYRTRAVMRSATMRQPQAQTIGLATDSPTGWMQPRW